MTHGPAQLDRRVLVAGGLGVLGLVTACDRIDAPDTPTPSADATTAPTGDEALRREITTAMAEVAELGAATATRFPPLRDLTDPFVSLHRSHGTMLGGLPQVEPPRVRGRRRRARRAFLAAEARLQRQLAAAALTAGSGALAQALASMAAGVAQRRAVAR